MFRSKAWKWLVLGSAITIIVLYMMELTTAGIERVYGPLEQGGETAQRQSLDNVEPPGLIPINGQEEEQEELGQADELSSGSDSTDFAVDQEIAALEAEIAELKRLALLKEKEELQQKLLLNEEHTGKPAVNRIADSTSEVLQSASSSGIQFIAKLFNNVIN
ncbi:hypothetical protein J40TS1_09890 [Paenibacillus montaniterrae]|uniref:Uncharacterized protein n=1 Tax=Paenibacillus montaniterrae TaxID=429341 RepID=A0A919YJ63_9BACL|nr:hypothetical protein [Paenibacillus montaniterrae]GIP15347.1 hypothetical protein J40TS1_09890 [Paenibacillus montaniterrae]